MVVRPRSSSSWFVTLFLTLTLATTSVKSLETYLIRLSELFVAKGLDAKHLSGRNPGSQHSTHETTMPPFLKVNTPEVRPANRMNFYADCLVTIAGIVSGNLYPSSPRLMCATCFKNSRKNQGFGCGLSCKTAHHLKCSGAEDESATICLLCSTPTHRRI